jgi:hypothetical protein
MRDDSHETRRQDLPGAFAQGAIARGLGLGHLFDLAQCVPAAGAHTLSGEVRDARTCARYVVSEKKLQHLEWVGIAVIISSITVVLWMMSAADRACVVTLFASGSRASSRAWRT